MNKWIFVLFGSLLVTSLVSAMQIDVYHSPSCPHCQKYLPIAEQIKNYFKKGNWVLHDITQESTNITAVPTTFIKTDDNREIIIQGNRPDKLFCEIQEMSTLDCPTLSADSSVGGSWFVWQ